MSRKNRVSVYDGVYHVTTRIANRAMLLEPEEVKERLQELIVDVAAFSGVEVWGFAVMDNHLHLIVHVPPVPKEYWLDPKDEPAAYAFGMRPGECRVPLWSGDSPSQDAHASPAGDSPRRPHHRRPRFHEEGEGFPAEALPAGGKSVGQALPGVLLGLAGAQSGVVYSFRRAAASSGEGVRREAAEAFKKGTVHAESN